jgi:hypothetical protein
MPCTANSFSSLIGSTYSCLAAGSSFFPSHGIYKDGVCYKSRLSYHSTIGLRMITISPNRISFGTKLHSSIPQLLVDRTLSSVATVLLKLVVIAFSTFMASIFHPRCISQYTQNSITSFIVKSPIQILLHAVNQQLRSLFCTCLNADNYLWNTSVICALYLVSHPAITQHLGFTPPQAPNNFIQTLPPPIQMNNATKT